MKDSKLLIMCLCLIGFFIVSLLLSFNSGFKQGIVQVKNCESNGGILVFENNNLKCDFNNSIINYNFSGVDLG